MPFLVLDTRRAGKDGPSPPSSEPSRRRPGGHRLRRKATWYLAPRHVETFADEVAMYAHALRSLGVVEGDGVAIMAKPCSEWFVLDLAAQSIGAVSIGFYVTTPSRELRRIVDVVRPKVLVLENDEYLDRFVGGDGATPPGGPSIVRLVGWSEGRAELRRPPCRGQGQADG